MWKVLVWTGVAVIAVSCVWQLVLDEPHVSRIVAAVLLTLTSLIVGMRVSYESSASFVTHVTRVNRLLGQQNQDLLELNLWFLKRRRAESGASSPRQERLSTRQKQSTTS